MLDTTRAYALEKLAESGEREPLARRHAEYYRDLFEQAEAEWETRPPVEWLADYGRQIDNLRTALDWAFSPGGDAEIGMALTAAAAPLWLHLSLLEECRSRVSMRSPLSGAEPTEIPRREMTLNAALGVSLLYASDTQLPAIGAAWTRTLELSEKLADGEYQLRALWGLWFFNWSGGRQNAALTFAHKFHALAAAVRPERSSGRRTADRHLAAVPGRIAQRPTASGAYARSLCPADPQVAHCSLLQ